MTVRQQHLDNAAKSYKEGTLSAFLMWSLGMSNMVSVMNKTSLQSKLELPSALIKPQKTARQR